MYSSASKMCLRVRLDNSSSNPRDVKKKRKVIGNDASGYVVQVFLWDWSGHPTYCTVLITSLSPFLSSSTQTRSLLFLHHQHTCYKVHHCVYNIHQQHRLFSTATRLLPYQNIQKKEMVSTHYFIHSSGSVVLCHSQTIIYHPQKPWQKKNPRMNTFVLTCKHSFTTRFFL